jgi:hypothetical protein
MIKVTNGNLIVNLFIHGDAKVESQATEVWSRARLELNGGNETTAPA